MKTTSFFTPVQDEIHLVEDLLRHQADDAHPNLHVALEHLLNSGGKRIRPTLTLLAGRMLGAPKDRLITLAGAVELLHTATLVHDDLIDGAMLRRGNPTLNAQWSPPATVLAGDYMFARAARLAADTDNLALMKYFAQTLATIVNGELTQLFSNRGMISRENYFQRIYAKTASLLELTTSAAAMLSPVGEDVVETMHRFGYNLGIAFQIVDDVLDFTGEEGEVGKPVGSDLMQGLVTLPVICYAESHPEDPGVVYLTSGRYGDVDIESRLVQSVRVSDAIDTSMQEAGTYIDKALASLAGMPGGSEHDSLEELAKYTLHRRI